MKKTLPFYKCYGYTKSGNRPDFQHIADVEFEFHNNVEIKSIEDAVVGEEYLTANAVGRENELQCKELGITNWKQWEVGLGFNTLANFSQIPKAKISKVTLK